MRWLPFGRKPAPPRRSEAFVQREFGEAIAFAAGEYRGFDRYFTHVDPAWHEKYSLRTRLNMFMGGPIFAELEARFPEIARVGADADATQGVTGHASVIMELIVAEAVIACGEDSREEVNAARSAEP